MKSKFSVFPVALNILLCLLVLMLSFQITDSASMSTTTESDEVFSDPAPFLYLPFNTPQGWRNPSSWFDHHFPKYRKITKPTTPEQQSCTANFLDYGLGENIAIGPTLEFPRIHPNLGEKFNEYASGVLGFWCAECDNGAGEYVFYDGHPGYDWGKSAGVMLRTPVYAAGSGTIIEAKCQSDGTPQNKNYRAPEGCGITIQHDSPNNAYTTHYFHLYNPYTQGEAVPWPGQNGVPNVGEHIDPWQQIAWAGGTCWKSTGEICSWAPHLHFEVHLNGHPVDPWGWTPYVQDPGNPDADPLQCYQGEKSYNLFVGYEPHCYGCDLANTEGNKAPEIKPFLNLVDTLPHTEYLGGVMYVDDNAQNDSATFITDITLPDGTVVSPNQSLVKTWRLQNTGTTTWGSGYQLVFINGDQMGAPGAVDIPVTGPGGEVDISVNLTSPPSEGNYTGYWRLRNPQGTYFGPTIWVQLNVQSQSNYITLYTDPPSPASADQVRIYARVDGLPNFRALRILVDGQPLCELGAPEIQDCIWHTNGYSAGEHAIVAEADDYTGSSWDDPERKGILFELTGGGANNYAPYRPVLVANPAYDWYVTIGNAPQLCTQEQGDPDGHPVTQYRFLASASVGTVDSGWVGSSCHTFGSITPGTYEWQTQVMDSQGGISEWSEKWHFTVEPTGVTAYIDHFSPASPSTAEQVEIFGCSSGHAGVNITLRVLVNDASNGTDSGEWHIIKEQGSPCFNATDVPIWNTLEYADGPHLVRVVAMAIEPDAGDYADVVYTLEHRRPDSTHLVAPVSPSMLGSDPIYLNTLTNNFVWQPTIRAENYTLHISTTPSPKDDPNPIFRQTFAPDVLSQTVTLAQTFPLLYWQVTASNDVGTNASGVQMFGIDLTEPSCTIQPLAPTTYDSVFQVSWGGTDNLAGVKSYDLQFFDSDHGSWVDWLVSVPVTKTYELFIGQPGHSYAFRCRATDKAYNHNEYPGNADTSTLIDPSAMPPTSWWDTGYSEKRNIIILNNMEGTTLPAGYSVHLHFDNSTTPTASELFNASQATPKCDDLRIVYLDTTELERVVQNCTTSMIDLWFRTQPNIPGGTSDNTTHQLYYGNPSPGTPPGDITTVFDPPGDANSVGLWYMHEGSGSTLYDSAGGNNCSIDGTTIWITPAKFSGALHFQGGTDGPTVNCGSASAFNLQTFTFELFMRRTGGAWGRLAGQLDGVQNRWLMELNGNGTVRVSIWPCPTCGSESFNSSTAIGDTNWHHVAFTLQNSTIKIYIDGQLDYTGTVQWGNINSGTPPLTIGSAENQARVFAEITHVQLSNIARTSFSYGTYSIITNEPSLAAGTSIQPPTTATPDLVLLRLNSYPNLSGGLLLQAVVQNQGDKTTQNGFFTDLYFDHLPSGAGDYTGSLQFWVNEPITPTGVVTLTTVIAHPSALPGEMMSLLGPTDEITGTLYAQTDSEGVVTEPDDQNNIFSAGITFCLAEPDAYEGDNLFSNATPISLGEVQLHNTYRPGDEDWIQFDAQAGSIYILRTFNLGANADTYLYLYDTDGTTLLASNDDSGGSLASRIDWVAPADGTYYIKIVHWNPNVSGCGTKYFFSLQLPKVYLPIIVR
ncbi:MAG: peptidoglycan DD-metalloendopeptidase family protein [Anaerolineales bacterium]|nr:peptidoglycan DD-metalloendopeptidase family protein [Anaerolineales bacterium]